MDNLFGTRHGEEGQELLESRYASKCASMNGRPLSHDSKECLAVLAEEEKCGTQLVQIGFMRRFDPSYAEIKSMLVRGDIGQALMFHCFHRNVAPACDFRPEMVSCNSAPHEFHVARWMLDSDFKSIRP
jgi:myo-inositol 2-dehydrogenase / D-chiro-inositol 1-dehydrogenase